MSSGSRETTGRRAFGPLGALVALLVALMLVAALLYDRAVAHASAGIGDPYYPEAGGSGYDALSYAIDVSYDRGSTELSGSTTVSLRTTEPLDAVHLDLKLAVSEVEVGGSKASFTQQGSDVAVQLPTVAGIPTTRVGTLLDIRVTYSGNLAGLRYPTGNRAVYWNGRETLISGEPEGASAWFPSDDHPSDPATYDITVHVPSGVEAISVGTLVGHAADAARPGDDTWHWRTETPAPTYTTMLAVGQYDVETVPVQIDGVERTAVYAVSESLVDGTQAMNWLKKSGPAVTPLEGHLGRYPIDALGGLVPGLPLDFGSSDSYGRPVYTQSVVGLDNYLAGEVAHQWIGDTVTLRQWRDICMTEATTWYLTWMSNSEAGGTTPQQNFDRLYASSDDAFWSLRLSNPGAKDLFARVYDRGPMVVHALRIRMGEAAFARFLTDWASQTGPRSLDDWRNAAEKESPVDVRPLLAAWLDGTSKVPATTENGFG